MQLLKESILSRGRVVGKDILKVDEFLNHQLDIKLLNEIGKEFKKKFNGKEINKILTIEASGIAIASIAAQYFDVPVVFAKKVDSKNLDKDTYETEVYSFTKARNYTVRVSKKFLNKEDNILILDDFLANGRASLGLIDLVNQSGARVSGIGIVIEKGFQEGGSIIRSKGITLESLAIIKEFKNGVPIFK
ncbi:xanthine phosphoribosyltransferase [Helicovermis profundi]|uniref:Xanthine phosphoribosyltransferase n=1 Tax=Helicovermis profundi TaxID=3065157 RepID=A0AAU9E412_9FIRM|nr:xanthine phosphoribosyltransferase [Clostridia bacterium S502]